MFFHSSYWHLVLAPFLTGPEILQLASVSRSLHARVGLVSRQRWIVRTNDPRFGMVSVPLHPVRTVAQVQRLFPRNTGYCITSRVHLQAGTQQTRFRAFREEVDHAVYYMSLQDDRPVGWRQISLVGAWVSKGAGGGNIGPDVLKNTNGFTFRLYESAYCPNTCVLPCTIANPDEVCPVLSDRRAVGRGNNPSLSPLYNWTLADYAVRSSVRCLCTIVIIMLLCAIFILWIMVSRTTRRPPAPRG